MISLYKDKKDCCGCTACVNICPNSAIEMKACGEGFDYPEINEGKCIQCGLCVKVCAFQNAQDDKHEAPPLVYAAKHKCDEVRMNSSSGGAFAAISDEILNRGGVIYGAGFDDSLTVTHQRAVTTYDRDRFRGSKYVQSDLGDIFVQVKSDLMGGKYVLFTGTPCQCGGLKSFLTLLKVPHDKLILCDLLCHGVPSPMVWKDHLKHVNKDIIDYKFRDKSAGWGNWRSFSVTITHNDTKQIKKIHLKFSLLNLFLEHYILRQACHNCKYTKTNRCSDITMADFWGIERCMPDFEDSKGVSLLLINTDKGKDLFGAVKHEFQYRESNIKDCMQGVLRTPTPAAVKRGQFWEDYRNKGYLYAAKKYTNYGLKNRMIRQTKSKVAKVLRKIGVLRVL